MTKLVDLITVVMLLLVVVPAHARPSQHVALPEVVRCSDFAAGSQILFLSCIEEQLGDNNEQVDDYNVDFEVFDDYGD